MNKRRLQKNSQSGFTIIETLVAIFILLISITGPMSFAQNGLRASFVARDQVVAFYLAQDAIETIKNIRDNNSLDTSSATPDWLTGLEDCTYQSADSDDASACEIQTMLAGTPVKQTRSCGTGELSTCPVMKYNSEHREFRLSTDTSVNSEPSKFSRTVFINEIEEDREAQIIVVVEWDTNFFADRKIVVQENMYNWVPEYFAP